MSESNYVLTIQCPDRIGVVAAVATFLARNDAFIVDSASYGDPQTGHFFGRISFRAGGPGFPSNAVSLEAGFHALASEFEMTWKLHDMTVKPKVIIAVSKFGHCLEHLLHQWRVGHLPCDIVGVFSNHEDMRDLVEWHRIPFACFPVTAATKQRNENHLMALFEDWRPDLLVLARYMQILTPRMCEFWRGRAINIHHSFLPSFKGASPYSQAHVRGVKIIGATAHYVTADLDEGPIIEQAVERVDHTYGVDDLVRTGRDIETVVLSRAVRWHLEHRIMLNQKKTVVFR